MTNQQVRRRLLTIAIGLIFVSAARADEPAFRIPGVWQRTRQWIFRCHKAKAEGGFISPDLRGPAPGAVQAESLLRARQARDSRLFESFPATSRRCRRPASPCAARIQASASGLPGGANWPAPQVLKADPHDWWSFRPLVRPAIPAPRPVASRPLASWARTPIDAFLLPALHSAASNPRPEADRRTLIRRLSFDLIGLPPEPAAVDAFIASIRRPTSGWWIGCWPRLATASAGPATGWMSCTMPTRTATTKTSLGRTPGPIATT